MTLASDNLRVPADLRRLARRLRAEPAPTAPPLLFFSQVPWWGVWQRPQEMALGFARRRPVIFLGPVQAHEIRSRYPRWKPLENQAQSRLLLLSPAIFSGQYRLPPVAALNRRLLAGLLKTLLEGHDRYEILTNTPLAWPLIHPLQPARLYYDAMDDYPAFDWAPPRAADWEADILRRADAVFTGTGFLERKHQARRPDACFIPCGVHYERFAPGPDGPNTEEPDELRGLPRPLIGYAGTLSERIDRQLLAALARRFPAASLVLVGPVHRGLGEPPRAPNIHYLGLQPHERLPAFLQRFDVALLPFRQTDAVRAINPVKALEYLAAGCLTVSTPIPDVERFHADCIFTASTHEEFLARVAEALEGRHPERRRLGMEKARHASWQAMVEAMEARMEGPA